MSTPKKSPKSSKSVSSSSSKFVFWMIGLVVVVIVGFIFLGHHENQSNNAANPVQTIDYKGEPYLGKSTAPVSIIEFGDYKCPNCKNFNETVLPIIKQELIDNGKAKWYFMNDSFINSDSITAAKFADSVYSVLGNNVFWKFHDLLYNKQPVGSQYEKMDVYTEKYLTAVLAQVASPTDVKKVVSNFEAHKSDAAWQKDMDLAQKLNVDGTPTLFVNGKLFNGKTLDDLKNMVDQAAKGK